VLKDMEPQTVRIFDTIFKTQEGEKIKNCIAHVSEIEEISGKQ
jgi:hypothetical protein